MGNPTHARHDIHSLGPVIRQIGAWLFICSILLPVLMMLLEPAAALASSTLVIVPSIVLLLVGLVAYCIGLLIDRNG